jgi:hypothetical protein
MHFSLYSALIPSYIQTLRAMCALVDKAEIFCVQHNLSDFALMEARLAADMRPFSYQIRSTAMHSIGALEGVSAGTFSPWSTVMPDTFSGLRKIIEDAVTKISLITPESIDELVGKSVTFIEDGEIVNFLSENFLTCFSQPNFYFHATTAYAILRAAGVPLRKADFTGFREPITNIML